MHDAMVRGRLHSMGEDHLLGGRFPQDRRKEIDGAVGRMLQCTVRDVEEPNVLRWDTEDRRGRRGLESSGRSQVCLGDRRV